MARFGYQMMNTPILDKADLFLTKAGDQVIEQLFVFEHLGQQWALRPEFTASATHHYIQSQSDSVVRWQYRGSIFENQSHLQQQHYQRYSAGAELIGANGISADVEIMAMATQGIQALGVSDWQLTIGHTGLLRQLLNEFNLDDRILRFLLSYRHLLREQGKQAMLEKLDHYLPESLATSEEITSDNVNTHQVVDNVLEVSGGGKTMGGRTRADVSRRLLKKRQQATQRDKILKAIDFLDIWIGLAGKPKDILSELRKLSADRTITENTITELSNVFTLLGAYGISPQNITLMPDLARHWDYYTGIVFEIKSNEGDLLCGGGRYDGLAQLIGSQTPVPAIGMAYQLGNVANLVNLNQDDKDFSVLLASDSLDDLPQWANVLRQHGIATVLQFSPDETIKGGRNTIQLNVKSDGKIYWNNAKYSIHEVESLIQAIREGVINDQ